MPLDRVLARLRQRITPTRRAAFLACFIAGYLIHLFAFTNIIPNSDGLSRVFDPQQMTVSGRWFLHYASFLNDFTQMPALIGFFSMVFLSLAAAGVVTALNLHSRALSAFAGVLMAAFPCLGYTFLYMFTASAYCLAILLAVLAVCLVKRGGWLRTLAGVVLLALALGIYQAYAAVAVALSLLVVLRACLHARTTLKGTARLGFRLAGFLAVGAALYYGILQIFLAVKDLELLDYLGMSDAGSGYPIAQLPGLILSAYKQVFVFFFWPNGSNSFTTPLLAGLVPPGPVAGALAAHRSPGAGRPAAPGGGLCPDHRPLLRRHPHYEVRLCAGLYRGAGGGRPGAELPSPAPGGHGRLRRPGPVPGRGDSIQRQHQQPAVHRCRPGPPCHSQLCHPAAHPH